jgi:dTMP kinase
MSEHGRFITFEGIDGSGKSTHIETVASVLRARGIKPVLTREPGGTPLGESLRGLVLNQPMTREAETMLMFAARAEHLAKVIRPALAANEWVLCDRFTDATYAYQAGGRGIDERAIAELEHWVHPDLQPALTILFDVAPEVAAQRLSGARSADRFESEPIAFFGAVRAMYLKRAAANPARFVVIDADQQRDAVRDQLDHLMRQWNG